MEERLLSNYFSTAIIGLQFFFWACAVQFSFIVIFFSEGVEGGGGLKLGLYVFHHNNNFNLINIYSAKTITMEHKKNYGSFTV